MLTELFFDLQLDTPFALMTFTALTFCGVIYLAKQRKKAHGWGALAASSVS